MSGAAPAERRGGGVAGEAGIAALWTLERRFWTADASFHATHLAPEAWLVLPAPVGLMDRAASLGAVGRAPRWSRAEFSGQQALCPREDMVLLVYAVEASREQEARGGAQARGVHAPYRAWCSSAYLRTPAGWRLVLHQQTPR